MKRLLVMILIPVFMSCSTTELVEGWKNPDIDIYDPHKVLIVGMTSNTEARQQFEERLKDEYQARGVEAVMSLELFEPSFTTAKKTESELKAMEKQLIDDGFDTILFSKVIGVEDKNSFVQAYKNYENTHRGFMDEYYIHQNIYYDPDYYEAYKIYHAETLLYCICPTKDRELIWKGYIDIVAPESIQESVDDYVDLVIAILEQQQLIPFTP